MEIIGIIAFGCRKKAKSQIKAIFKLYVKMLVIRKNLVISNLLNSIKKCFYCLEIVDVYEMI